MATEILELGPCKRQVKVVVARADVEQELDRNYQQLQGSIRLKGFRQGHVPRKLLERRYGPKIVETLRGDLVRDRLASALEEHKLEPIGEPELEMGEFDPSADPAFSFEATVQIKPTFELPDLKGVVVTRKVEPVTDEEAQGFLDNMATSQASWEDREQDETVCEEDTVIAKVEKFAGEELKATEEQARIAVASGLVGSVAVKDLADQLKDAKVADMVELTPDAEALKPEEAELTSVRVHVERIQKRVAPALDDAFAKRFELETLEELKAKIRERLEAEHQHRADQQVDKDIISILLQRVDFPLPDDLIDRELDELALKSAMRARWAGASEEDADAQAGAVRADSRETIERDLRSLFFLDRVASQKRLFVTDDEVMRSLVQQAMQRGMDPEKLLAQWSESGDLKRLRHDLRVEKARMYLREKAQVDGDVAPEHSHHDCGDEGCSHGESVADGAEANDNDPVD